MTREEALRVLGLEGTPDKKLIKKTYRALMHSVHPDVQLNRPSEYAYSAREINAAYEYLMQAAAEREKVRSRKKQTERKRWNAPVNEGAYAEREIYQFIESYDGVRRERFCVAAGKYFWIPDEDYKLFLFSIYNLSRTLLEGFSETVMNRYQGELAYLLFQQFIDPDKVLERYSTDDAGIYYIPAMLESEGKRCLLKEGTALYPKGVKDHRLYVQSEAGKTVGYLSFADDHLYYAVVPLFEQKRVQVKIRISGSTFGNNNVRKVVVRSLDLWIRMLPSDQNEIMQSISTRIGQLLEHCACEEQEP